MADGSIVIDTKIDSSGLSKQVDELKNNLESIGKTLTVAVTAPITALGVFATKAFSDAEKGDARLRASLEMTGQNVEQMFDKYQKLGSAIQEVTDIDDDAVKALATFGTQLGVTSDAMEDTIKGAIGLSKITGADLQQSMKMAAMAGQGEFMMLERLSPEMRAAKTDAEKYAIAQKLMASGYKLAEAEGKTFSGSLSKLKNDLGDLGEQFGQIIAEMLMPFLKMLQDAIKWFQSLSPEIKKAIVVFGLLAASIGPALLGVVQITKAIQTLTATMKALDALAKSQAVTGWLKNIKFGAGGALGALAAVLALVLSAIAAYKILDARMNKANDARDRETHLFKVRSDQSRELEKQMRKEGKSAIEIAEASKKLGKVTIDQIKDKKFAAAAYKQLSAEMANARAEIERLQKTGGDSAQTKNRIRSLQMFLEVNQEQVAAYEAMNNLKVTVPTVSVEGMTESVAEDLDEIDYRFSNTFFNLGLAAQKASNAGVGKAISGLFDFMKEKAKDTEEYMFLSGIGMNENLASGIVAGVHFAVSATKFLVENIAGAFQKTFAIFSDAFSILSFLADFSPSDLFDSFKGFIEGLTEFFTKDLGSLPIFFDAGMELLENFLDGMVKNLPAIVTTIGNVIIHVIDYISENADKIIKQVLTILAAIGKAILKQLPKFVEAIIKSLISLMKNLKEIAPPMIKAFVEALSQIIQIIAEYAPDIVKALVALQMAIFKGLIDNSPMILRALANALPYIIVALTVIMTVEIAKASPAIAVALIKALIMSIYMVPAGLISALYDLGKQIIDGIVNGILVAGNIWDKVKKVFTDFVDKIKSFFGIASPSKLFYDFGVDIMQGLINGLNSMMGGLGSVVDKIKDLLGGIGGGIGNFWDDVTDAMPSIPKPSVPNIPKPSNPFKKPKKPKLFATGTRSAPGGLAMVGERGPELVGLSKGSQVFTATKTGQLLNSIMQGLSSASGLGNMTPSGAYAGQNITLNNKMSGTLSVDGREIGRIAFENIDRFAMGAYGYNR